MSPRFLTVLLIGALLALPACSGGSKKKGNELSATVGGSGPQVSDSAPPPPTPEPPAANQTLYVANIVDAASGNPIGGAFCSLMRTEPDPEFMRVPARRDVISQQYTPLHGQFAARADADNTQKWILVSGRGFDPFLTDAGVAAPGQTHTLTIKAKIIPVCEFIVLQPNGDRADNAVVTMAPTLDQPALEGKMASRGTSGNIGTTERADDAGKATFNRTPGSYRLTFSDRKGRYRKYEIFEWSGTQDKPVKVQLPAKSESKPW
ncbi:MAG: hypothetical protein ACYSU1_08195 [Planctomycetota bacterium]|jgi:hypothetical protein